jgi:hypothetical protein
VREIRPDLTEDQAIDVLQVVYDNHNADIGISWDTLEFWADSMFPRNPARQSFTVEITETLQLRLEVEARSSPEALAKAERAYQSGEYILDARHFTGVDFSVLDDERGGGEANG